MNENLFQLPISNKPKIFNRDDLSMAFDTTSPIL